MDLSHGDVAKGAICGSDGAFHFFEQSKNRVVKFGAVAVNVLHLSREKGYAKSNEAGSELFVQGV